MFQTMSDRDFNRNFLISFGVHTLFVVTAFFGSQIMFNVFKNNDVEIIRSSVRVDVVGMPKFTIQELREMQTNAPDLKPEVAQGEKIELKPEVIETPDIIKKDDLVIQETGKEKKSSFLNILTDYSKKKVSKKEKAKGEVKGSNTKNLDSLIVEGNRLSKGSSLVGDFSDDGGSEFASYVQTLPDSIRGFWKLPSYLMEKDLRCRIKIFLSATGSILKLEVQESSGNPEFDARAENAIRSAAPFPRPSEVVGARLSSSGIILGFPL